MTESVPVRAVLGIDIGTSSSKGLLVDLSGRVLAEATTSHEVDRPAQGLVEMDSDTWWSEFCDLTRRLLAAVPGVEVAAVGVSGIGPCVLVTDADGAPLRPAILYGVDTRTSSMLGAVTAELGGEDAIRTRCGSALSTQAAGVKLAWLARNEPETWAKTVRFTMPSSRIVEKLTGEYVLDHHSASQCTPLYDVHANAWIADWSEQLAPGLVLPRLLWSGERAGSVSQEAAAATGLRPGIPVTAGTIDAWAEGVSVGSPEPGRMFLQYGTTMFMIVPTTEPRSVTGMWTNSGTSPGHPSVSGGLATSGAITDWVRQLTGANWDDILTEAEDSGVGARGLLMLPYFAGERTPLADPEARGVIAGLTIRHTRGDLYRAVLEGTAFAVRHNIEVLQSAGVEVRTLVGAGGGLLGRLWPQIVSDVCGIDQVVPTIISGASFGSAFLAAGLVADVSIDDWNPPATVIHPNLAATAEYEAGYRDFRKLYPDTVDIVHRLAART